LAAQQMGAVMRQERPSVHVLALGGTIAMDRDTASAGVVPVLAGERLVAAVPGLADAADVEVADVRRIPGAHLTVADLEALAREIRERLAAGADGVVVVQGTDTIEESSFVLDLLLAADRPVVVTGAMRNAGQAGADGPANLLAAVQVAASSSAAGLGVLVVLNDELHAARLVRKLDAVSTAAFGSPGAGPLGRVVEGAVHVLLRPAPAPAPTPAIGELAPEDAPVALLSVGLGESGRLIDAVAGCGYSGAVVEAMGVGHVPPSVADALERLAAVVPVVLASRTCSSVLARATYGFPGSESDLLGRGLIPAPFGLDARKARLLLSLLLRTGRSRAQIAEAVVG
jgi:L-asparaginase